MWYSATVNAYDVMDQVHVIVSVRSQSEDRSECIETVLHHATTLSGEGETDPALWLQDVLVAALELL